MLCSKNLLGFLKGLACSIVATFFFGAFDWIKVGSEMSKFVSMPIVGAIMWLAMSLLGWIALVILVLLIAAFDGIALLVVIIGLSWLGYFLANFSAFILPSDIATFSLNDIQSFIVGLYYSITFAVFYPDLLNNLGKKIPKKKIKQNIR